MHAEGAQPCEAFPTRMTSLPRLVRLLLHALGFASHFETAVSSQDG